MGRKMRGGMMVWRQWRRDTRKVSTASRRQVLRLLTSSCTRCSLSDGGTTRTLGPLYAQSNSRSTYSITQHTQTGPRASTILHTHPRFSTASGRTHESLAGGRPERGKQGRGNEDKERKRRSGKGKGGRVWEEDGKHGTSVCGLYRRADVPLDYGQAEIGR